jgi:hypothetical protein
VTLNDNETAEEAPRERKHTDSNATTTSASSANSFSDVLKGIFKSGKADKLVQEEEKVIEGYENTNNMDALFPKLKTVFAGSPAFFVEKITVHLIPSPVSNEAFLNDLFSGLELTPESPDDLILKGIELFEKKNEAESLKQFKVAAKKGSALGYYFLGLIYKFDGSNPFRTFHCFYTAAKVALEICNENAALGDPPEISLDISKSREIDLQKSIGSIFDGEDKQSTEENLGPQNEEQLEESIQRAKSRLGRRLSKSNLPVVYDPSKPKYRSLQNIPSDDIAYYKSELAMVLLELAVCYQKGISIPKQQENTLAPSIRKIPKNKYIAAYYYLMSARLKDPDSQIAVANCYFKGFGVPKNKFRAAHYFQLAEQQGYKVVGNSWIHKSKYEVPDIIEE